MTQEGQSRDLLEDPPNRYEEAEPGSIDQKKRKRVRTGLICCHLILWWTIGGGLWFILIWCFFGCILFPCGNAGRRCFTLARVCITPLRYHLKPSKCCGEYKKCGKGFCGGLIWSITIGFHMMVFHFLMALIFLPWNLCNIPMSRTHIKLGRIAFRPFNATITRKEEHEMYYVVGASGDTPNDSYHV